LLPRLAKPGANAWEEIVHRHSVQWLAASLIVLCSAQGALALPLTPFRYEAQAQQNCPDDTVVWLDFKKGRYYLKGQRRYARGHTGSYVCRNEARDSGYRRSLLGLR
jgi:hypothetical protein